MTAVDEATIEQRVEAGAAWLDEHQPGWIDRIVVELLNVQNECRCVLGQMYGSYYQAPMLLRAAVNSGFDISDATYRGTDADIEREYAALTEAWRALIERRRAEAGAA